MDWNTLKNKLQPLAQKLHPYLEKAKNAGYKAVDFTGKQLQNTPLMIKTHDDYIDLQTRKRAILIGYDGTHPQAREVLLRAPLWGTQAWSDAADLRYIDTSLLPQLAREMGFLSPVNMRVWYTGKETFFTDDLSLLLNWWNGRCYDGLDPKTEVVPQTPMDPLGNQ
jgi:hypothetical protein